MTPNLQIGSVMIVIPNVPIVKTVNKTVLYVTLKENNNTTPLQLVHVQMDNSKTQN